MQRTASHLRNIHLFYQVDFVVFVEGGRGDREGGTGGEAMSIDVAFWKTIFEEFAPHKSVKMKAVGSKSCLIPVAEIVESEDVRRVIVAADRDFDFHTGEIRAHPRVIYSRGYSWENDVWDLDDIVGLIRGLSIYAEFPNTLVNELEETVRNFKAFASRVARLDVATVLGGMPPLIRRKDVRRYVHVAAKSPPRGNRTQVLRRISEYKACRTTALMCREDGCRVTERDCCGHLVGVFAFHLLVYVLGRQGVRATGTKDFAHISAIREFRHRIKTGNRPAVESYYRNVLMDAVGASA